MNFDIFAKKFVAMGKLVIPAIIGVFFISIYLFLISDIHPSINEDFSIIMSAIALKNEEIPDNAMNIKKQEVVEIYCVFDGKAQH